MYVPKIYFGPMEDFITHAIEEGNYFSGYKKIIIAHTLDPDLEKEGLDILRQAVNATQALYRFRKDIETLGDRKQAEAVRQFNANKDSGEPFDQGALDAFDKEVRKVEHKVVARAYDLSMLRDPLDDFLAEADIPVRDKYNKKNHDEY